MARLRRRLRRRIGRGMFQQCAVSEDVPVVKVALGADGLIESAEDEVKVTKLLVLAGLAASAGEATRKLAENAVKCEWGEV